MNSIMKKSIEINEYSMTSYYVDILFNDIKLSNATCFFTRIKETLYLVTNWHVVSGRNADTKNVWIEWEVSPINFGCIFQKKPRTPLSAIVTIFIWMLSCLTEVVISCGTKCRKITE